MSETSDSNSIDRLKEASEACLKSYEAWDADKKEVETRENLQETIHELRKVVSRVEIEIAMSERTKTNSKPIPIPSHRSQNKKDAGNESILPDGGHTEGKSGNGGKPRSNGGGVKRPRTRRPAPKKQD